MTDKLDIADSGPNGVLARLLRDWNPDGIARWMRGEELRNTDLVTMAACLAEVGAGGAFAFAKQTDNARDILTHPKIGIANIFVDSIYKKLARHTEVAGKTAGGVFLPHDGFSLGE